MDESTEPVVYRNVQDVLARVQDTVPYLGIELRDINQRCMFGDTPLMVVVFWDDIAAATLLLEAGADVNAKGEDGYTALHYAASRENIELVRLLLANSASTSAKTDWGDTPLDLAKLHGHMTVAAMLSAHV